MNAAMPTAEQVLELENQVLALLSAAPAGLTEHQVLKYLREHHALFAAFNPREPLSLFRGHFLLFHVLYRLRARLRQQGSDVIIGPLHIAWVAAKTLDDFASGSELLLPVDGDDAGAWYQDLQRWATMTAAEVMELLQQFPVMGPTVGKRRAALEQLGLQDPVDDAAIKQRYRRLVLEHHPDRGGDGDSLCQINLALKVLKTGARQARQS
jgi:hypothetical protein